MQTYIQFLKILLVYAFEWKCTRTGMSQGRRCELSAPLELESLADVKPPSLGAQNRTWVFCTGRKCVNHRVEPSLQPHSQKIK